jgi:hypothetical protein
LPFPIEAQPLRFHALDLLVEGVHFLIAPRILRLRRVASAQLFERFLDGEFGGFSHGNPHLRCLTEKPVQNGVDIVAGIDAAQNETITTIALDFRLTVFLAVSE